MTANQTVTVTASYASGGVTRTATQSVTIVNVAATLTSIAVSGPSSVNEGATGTYTATATWSDSSTTIGHPDLEREPWDDQRRGAVHRAVGDGEPDGEHRGELHQRRRDEDGDAVRDHRERGGDADQHRGERPVVGERGRTGTYTATATWSDSTTTAVTPTWSENSSYATISAGGCPTASAVTSNQTVTVTASYASGGVTRRRSP